MNVLEVVKKLRVLADPARNDNVHQRNAAKRKADELMAKHEITAADLNSERPRPFMKFDMNDMEGIVMKSFFDALKNMQASMKGFQENVGNLGAEVQRGKQRVRAAFIIKDDIIKKAMQDYMRGKKNG